MLVRDVGQAHITTILEPIWLTKTETASRVRSRIELVLDWATTRGFREGPNPARWRGHLDKLMPKPTKVSKVEHHRALPAAAMGSFMVDLRVAEGMGARALEFAILTAARSGEVRGAEWGEIDLDGALWTVPADRMKSGREHRVPLSRAALKVLRALPRLKGSPLVFWSGNGSSLSDMTLSAVTRRMGVNAVPHGFRSTFRDWAAESTDFPREVAEAALAHVLPDRTEAAYRRGDLFTKRAKLMDAWATFCARVPADVVTLSANRETTTLARSRNARLGSRP
jgi:integrase